jgi:ATP-binding cassette subfamily B protein
LSISQGTANGTGQPGPARLAVLLRQSGRRWLSIVKLLPRAGWFVVSCAILENLAIGLLPIGFIVGTSVMVSRLPTLAHQDSARSWALMLPPLLLSVGALVLQNLLVPLQPALGELVTRRVDGHCTRRLAEASISRAPMIVLEDQEVLSRLNDARTGLVQSSMTPGSAVAGLLALVSRYSQLIGSVVLVGIVLGPFAAVVTAGAAMTARVAIRTSLSISSSLYAEMRGGRRKVAYINDAGIDPGLSKEIRVLGLLDWFKARSGSEYSRYLPPLWRMRRRVYFTPFFGYTAIVLVGFTGVLLLLRDAALGGDVSVLELSLAVQAIYVAVRFGVFFPEADIQTMFGIQANDSIVDLERRFAVPAQPRMEQRVPTEGLPRSSIRFEAVRFSYPGAQSAVLDRFDLELIAGQSTAIVGLNGAGKTTVVKLLTRLYEPQEGRILVDDVDLTAFEVRSWQRRLAVIFQDYVRYELDAKANVGLGAPERLGDATAIQNACRKAGAAEIVDCLPAGAATPLSSRYRGGVDLSGGQWQRIALARALFAVGAGASVLVLDEPTAHLDIRAEVAFFDEFLALTTGLTTVVISHRFSTVRRADRIVVVEGGRVAEEGTHDELVCAGGQYALLFQLQQKRFAEQESGDQT